MAENQNAADQASTLNDERATRLAKRAALFEAGQNPYPEHSEICLLYTSPSPRD